MVKKMNFVLKDILEMNVLGVIFQANIMKENNFRQTINSNALIVSKYSKMNLQQALYLQFCSDI